MNTTTQQPITTPVSKTTTNGCAGGRGTNRLGALASWCYRHRRPVLGLWLVLLVGVTAMSQVIPGRFENKFAAGNSESARAQRLLQQRFPARAGDTGEIVFRTADRINSPAVRDTIGRVLEPIRGLAHVSGLQSPFGPGGQGLVGRDGHTAYAIVQFDQTTDNLSKPAIQAVVDQASRVARPGLEVEFGGQTFGKVEKFKFGTSEIVGIWAAIFILLIAFGSVIAMGLPVLTALLGIAISFGILDFISRGVVVPTFGSELAAMIGIGVGIDYSLFVVTRYRQALHDGQSPEDAVITSLSTSGRAVLFAGCTVVISLMGMFLLGLSFVYGLALGAVAAVILVMAATLTLLPAMLGFTGHAIDRLHLPHLLRRGHQGDTKHSMWWRWSRVVQRRPWIAAGASLAVLVILALPLFSMHLAFTDAGNNATSTTSRRAYDLLAKGFGAGSNGPLIVAVDLSSGPDQAVVTRLVDRLQHTPGVAFVVPPSVDAPGNAAVIVVIPTTSPQDLKTVHLVHVLRGQVIPATTGGSGVKALVGGETAAAVDASTQLSGRLPLVIGAVVVLSFLLLMAVFRSVAVPLKAAVMNLLSVGAAYGVIVAVFQWGWLGSVVGIGKTGPIDPWVPLMMFTILFGLSMDYEVFLLSRVREEWRRTGDNATAVADGLAGTARVITAAAAIMVCVFGSFVLGDVRVLKLFGLGLATAIFVDASLVRMILVPATMELLGGANWWFPHWLDRLVPTLSVEVDVHTPELGHVATMT
jgi:putative drug exporter of the RND superfamily